jgi:hypothetical protein
MNRVAALLVPLLSVPAFGQTHETFDYWRYSREIIEHGQQAIFMCNGVFTSNRTLEQVFEKELAYLSHPVGTPDGGDYVVDREKKTVAIGGGGGTPTVRAAFREGIGCVVLAPDQTFDDIERFPGLTETSYRKSRSRRASMAKPFRRHPTGPLNGNRPSRSR